MIKNYEKKSFRFFINSNFLLFTFIPVSRRSDRSGSRSPSRSPSPRDKEHSPVSSRSRSDSFVKGHDEVGKI